MLVLRLREEMEDDPQLEHLRELIDQAIELRNGAHELLRTISNQLHEGISTADVRPIERRRLPRRRADRQR